MDRNRVEAAETERTVRANGARRTGFGARARRRSTRARGADAGSPDLADGAGRWVAILDWCLGFAVWAAGGGLDCFRTVPFSFIFLFVLIKLINFN